MGVKGGRKGCVTLSIGEFGAIISRGGKYGETEDIGQFKWTCTKGNITMLYRVGNILSYMGRGEGKKGLEFGKDYVKGKASLHLTFRLKGCVVKTVWQEDAGTRSGCLLGGGGGAHLLKTSLVWA